MNTKIEVERIDELNAVCRLGNLIVASVRPESDEPDAFLAVNVFGQHVSLFTQDEFGIAVTKMQREGQAQVNQLDVVNGEVHVHTQFAGGNTIAVIKSGTVELGHVEVVGESVVAIAFGIPVGGNTTDDMGATQAAVTAMQNAVQEGLMLIQTDRMADDFDFFADLAPNWDKITTSIDYQELIS